MPFTTPFNSCSSGSTATILFPMVQTDACQLPGTTGIEKVKPSSVKVVGATTNPAILCIITPPAVSAVVGTTDPVMGMDDIVTPGSVTVIGVTTGPDSTETITETVSAIGATTNPSVFIEIIAGSASAIGATTNPSIIESITETVSAVGATTGPDSVEAITAIVSAIGATTGPDSVETIMAVVSAIGATTNPTVSVGFTPSAITAVGATTGPDSVETVTATVSAIGATTGPDSVETVTALVSAIGATTGPDIVETVTATVSAIGATTNPTVIASFTPSAVTAIGATTNPTITTIVIPAAASAIGATTNPTVITPTLKVKVDAIAQPLLAGNQVISGLTFAPEVLIVWGSQLRNTTGSELRLGIGFGISGTDRYAAAIASGDNVASPTLRRFQKTDAIFILGDDASSTIEVEADLVSLDSDGFTLDWVTGQDLTKDLNYMAIGGTTITDVDIISFDSPTVTGNQSITSLTFQPDAIFLLTPLLAGATASATDARLSIGFGTASEQAVSTVVSLNNGTSDTSRGQRTDKIVLGASPNQATFISGGLVSLDANGFTINWTTVPGTSRRIFALCLKGGNYKVGSDTQKTSTGLKATTGMSFTPAGAWMQSVSSTTSASIQTESILSIGASHGGSANSAAATSQDKDNVSTTDSNRSMRDGKCLELRNSSFTMLAEAHIDSLESGGFTLDWTTADATAREFVYLAMG